MKHSLLFVACLFSGISHAQVWAPVGATWHYSFYIPFFTSGYVHFEVVGDTVIGGLASRTIARSTHYYDSSTEQYGSWQMNPIFSHTSEGIIWIYVPAMAAYDTLYNFNAVPSDNWQLAAMPQPVVCEPQSRMEVTDTGTTVIDGVPLRWLAVDVHYINSLGDEVWQDTIVERLGTGQYMLPHDFCNGFIDGAQGGGLLCYADAEIDYMVPFINECDLGLGIGPSDLANGMIMYPNPGHEQLTIQLTDADSRTSIIIRDAQGRLIATQEVTTTKAEFDTRTWAAGVYMVEKEMAAGLKKRCKWIKQ